MKFTPRQDGTQRATVQVAFHVLPGTLVTAAMHVVSFKDVTPEQLTKAAIEDELRGSLWLQGDSYIEYGREQVQHEAHEQLDAIERKVAELYGVEV